MNKVYQCLTEQVYSKEGMFLKMNIINLTNNLDSYHKN